MSMQMKLLAAPPSKMVNKAVSTYELEKYFQADSAESLIDALEYGERKGLFNFDVTVSKQYLDWLAARHKLLNPTSLGVDLGFRKPAAYELYGISDKIKNGEALSKEEVQRVIRDVPHDMLERYLRFRLHDIDYKELHGYLQPKTSQAEKDEDYGMVQYKGLVANGAKITYYDQPIYMGFQHRQVLRLLIEQQGELCSKGEFFGNVDLFTSDSYSSDMDSLLRNLIYEARKKLKVAVGGNCIKNMPREGWHLKLPL